MNEPEKWLADLCGTLFTQADMAISQRLPELLTCQQTVTKTTPQTACTAETEAAAILQERVTALDRENTRLQAQMSRLQTDLAARKQLSDDSATATQPNSRRGVFAAAKADGDRAAGILPAL
jgi:hypothetical protein